MEIVKCYQDLCGEIEIYEERLGSLIAQYDASIEGWLKPIGDISGIDYSKPRVQENHYQLDMEEQLPHIDMLEKDIDKYQRLIKNVRACQESIENRINNMKGVESKIAYMRTIEGKNLKKIAEELNYSYGYIRKLATKQTF